MKDIFNRRQRFSLRKYSFGVASVLLGTALFAAHTAHADEVVASDASSSNPHQLRAKVLQNWLRRIQHQQLKQILLQLYLQLRQLRQHLT